MRNTSSTFRLSLLLSTLLLLGGGGAIRAVAQSDPYSEKALLADKAPGPYIHLTPADVAQIKPFAADQPLVATYYFYWYDVNTGEHFVTTNGSDALTHHPLTTAGYSYREPEWHRRQLLDMADAGIDVVLPVYWGTPTHNNKVPAWQWTYTGLAPLVQAAEQLEKEGKAAPKIGLFYDTSTLRHNEADRVIDLTTNDGRAWFYTTIRDYFSRIPPRLWATRDKKPLVFLYSAEYAKAGRDDPQLVDYVRRHFAQDFGGVQPYIVQEQSWKLRADATYSWSGALGLKLYDVAALGPGYDNTNVQAATPIHQSREGGAFYQRAWNALLALDPARRPKIVAVETWNELHEGTDIAETREYGRQYIDLTRRFATLWKQKARFQPTGRWAETRTLSLTFEPNAPASGLSLHSGGDGPAAIRHAGADYLESLPVAGMSQKYLYFDVDENFYANSGRPLQITVEYWDGGTQPFVLEYDALSSPYKPASSILRTNTQQWKQAVFTLNDARFLNAQNQLSDFRLASPSDELKIRRITVRKM